jgi:regulator of sigma E protease
MIDESMDREAMKQPAQPWEFRSKPAWQRLIVMVAGVFMNIVVACCIYIGMSWHWGYEYTDNKDVEWGYTFNELAHEIGFHDGDKIVYLDGESVGDISQIYSDMVINRVETVTVERGGERIDIDIPVEYVSAMLSSPDFISPRMPFEVGIVAEGGGAAEAGIEPGDRLVALGGESMTLADDYAAAFAACKGDTVAITVARDSAGVNVVRELQVEVSDEGTIGVYRVYTLPRQTLEYNFWQAIPAGFHRTGAEISGYWNQIKLIFTPKTEAYKSVGSLISIGNIFPGEWNWYAFWKITALLSVILAVMNILPIPALDGGHVFFLLWEVITRRKPSDKFMEWAQVFGMIILFALLIFAFGNDIYRFFIK